MNIYAASDLHNEFYRTLKNGRGIVPELAIPANTDVIVLAGDIDIKLHGIYFANNLAKKYGIPVIYVHGNHEFYSCKYPGHINKMRNAAGPGVHFLENDSVIIDDVRFIGCSLWTDGLLYGQDNMLEVINAAIGNAHVGGKDKGMSDYKKIRYDGNTKYRPLHPIDIFKASQKSQQYLDDTLAMPFEGNTVVVTHHAPSARSLEKDWSGKIAAAFYVNTLDDLIIRHQPALWIHGHLHNPCGYNIGNTRIHSNPRGYKEHQLALSTECITIPRKLFSSLDLS